jgi:hypothetical protein
MKNIIAKEWITYKTELEASLSEAIDNESPEKETIELMLEMLKNSKLKNRRQTKNE